MKKITWDTIFDWITVVGIALGVLLVSLFLTGCVSVPITHPDGPGGVIVTTDSTGVIFNQTGKDLWVREGVPAEWFTPVGTNWHLTNLYWHAGNSIRVYRSNK